MCGRFTQIASAEALREHFQLDASAIATTVSYNIAPTQQILTLSDAGSAGYLKLRRWGLIPSWIKNQRLAAPLINARSETVAEKPSFKQSFVRRRCLIPATGYYEWSNKIPYYFSLKQQPLFSFAGIWAVWTNGKDETIESVAIITTKANELTAKYHSRMPVIIPQEHYQSWLTAVDTDSVRELLQPYFSEKMQVWQVSQAVNSYRCNVPTCIEPINEKTN